MRSLIIIISLCVIIACICIAFFKWLFKGFTTNPIVINSFSLEDHDESDVYIKLDKSIEDFPNDPYRDIPAFHILRLHPSKTKNYVYIATDMTVEELDTDSNTMTTANYDLLHHTYSNGIFIDAPLSLINVLLTEKDISHDVYKAIRETSIIRIPSLIHFRKMHINKIPLKIINLYNMTKYTSAFNMCKMIHG